MEGAIRAATDAILAQQKPDGHWVYELEADATIPAEYVLLVHYLAETPNLELERKIGVYLRRIQGAHGGWPLYHDGAFDISATVKAYFALKMIGDDIDAPHMARAREAIRARGGAIKANVFTRILLALYGQTSWANVPTVPVELILLPRWFPVHLSKMSYWARTVIVPLLVLAAKKPAGAQSARRACARTVRARRARRQPRAPHQSAGWSAFFAALDRILKVVPWPKGLRARAIEKCRAWTTERLNGEDGLGAIYPAMANSVMMYDVLGYPPDHPDRAIARKSVENLLVVKDDEAYCQPCVSPVWDTALVAHALLETKDAPHAEAAVARGLEWLKPLQVLDVKGDWAEEKPDVRPGGWAFQYRNDHYPDLDDTAVVVMAMDRARKAGVGTCIRCRHRARRRMGGRAAEPEWRLGRLRCRQFLLLSQQYSLRRSWRAARPADRGCLGPLCRHAGAAGRRKDDPRLKAGIDYLIRTQRDDGSWWGRWGVNYIYGTWSALAGLNGAGLAPDHPTMKRGADWLVAIQNPDGGWGENCDSYKLDYKGYEPAPSTASQTAWALLGLMAAGQVDHPAVARGINYLKATQEADGLWSQAHYTGGGFPRVFYLNYHGYPKFFPLWALARYRNLKTGNSRRVEYGL